MIEKLQRVHLREVWKHEAIDFTQWLQENLDALNEALDFNLVSADREQAAGSFSVDLIGEDESGASVVIENQLEKSDHDHLGKLLTYLASFSARAAIWIVSEPRPEHAAAIAWLNQTSLADFYLVKVEAVKIGDSSPAALFTKVVGPSEESKSVGRAKDELVQRHVERERFWVEIIERSKGRTKLFTNKKPDHASWMAIGAGKSGLGYAYVVLKDKGGQVELYIDRGKDCELENLAIFRALQVNKQRIEEAFGAHLDWQELEGKRACRIRYKIDDGGWGLPESWPKLQDAMIDAMIRFESAFRPEIQRLDFVSGSLET
jgi:hypothetical protein